METLLVSQWLSVNFSLGSPKQLSNAKLGSMTSDQVCCDRGRNVSQPTSGIVL